MPTYKTPGVYVEEIPTLPPSVAEVSTAVPAFLGYTEKGPPSARVSTLLEYQELFGGADPTSFTVTTAGANGSTTVTDVRHGEGSDVPRHMMYYCVSHYFKNGGGPCYVLSVGKYAEPPAPPVKKDFLDALGELEKEDEPTLIVLTDAVHLAAADYYEVCGEVLSQCDKLGDRFAIFDVKDGKVDEFRDNIGVNHLRYAAAYHPYLRTSLSFQYREPDVLLEGPGFGAEPIEWTKVFGSIKIVYSAAGSAPTAQVEKGEDADPVTFEIAADKLVVRGVSGKDGSTVAQEWTAWVASPNDPAGFDVVAQGDGTGEVAFTGASVVALEHPDSLTAVKTSKTALYNAVKAALAVERVELPPSAAMAGVYASVDRDRGVWKAPANVSVAAVIGPSEKITHEAQEGLNVDPTGGKSINAIREFAGKGTLVWGARTLAGNDNEWRYVPVRRLFNMIEESAKKASAFAVFEGNDATTWLKVRGMIEGFLYGLWERGAFAGSTPESAYYVHVGLGRTMTAQDVLEGRMIVEIGVAAVRPAEFIVLRFAHKLQEA